MSASMFGVLLQFLEQLHGAIEKGRIAKLSDAQWDLTLSELRRQHALEVEAIRRQGIEQENEIKKDQSRRGLSRSTTPRAVPEIEYLQEEIAREVENTDAVLRFNERMIELERKKLR